jgi:hypothetical protein
VYNGGQEGGCAGAYDVAFSMKGERVKKKIYIYIERERERWHKISNNEDSERHLICFVCLIVSVSLVVYVTEYLISEQKKKKNTSKYRK